MGHTLLAPLVCIQGGAAPDRSSGCPLGNAPTCIRTRPITRPWPRWPLHEYSPAGHLFLFFKSFCDFPQNQVQGTRGVLVKMCIFWFSMPRSSPGARALCGRWMAACASFSLCIYSGIFVHGMPCCCNVFMLYACGCIDEVLCAQGCGEAFKSSFQSLAALYICVTIDRE